MNKIISNVNLAFLNWHLDQSSHARQFQKVGAPSDVDESPTDDTSQ